MPEQNDLDLERQSLQRRLVQCIERKVSELGPQALLTNTSIYTDTERHAAEHREIFRRTPLLAGLSGDLPQPGSTLVFDAYGPSVIITRQADGSLTAFRNLCPHRGARLVANSGRHEGFVCPFHGWRFSLEGRLQHRAQADAFPDGTNVELDRIAVAERHGLVFIQHEGAGGGIDLKRFLGPMDSLLQAFQLGQAEPVGMDPMTVDVNWKLVVDVSCEGYHVPTTHPQTLSPQLVPFLTVHDHYGRHHRFASPGRTLQALVGVPEHQWPDSDYSAVHYLFPNTVLTVSDAIDGGLPVIAINRSFPVEVGRTHVIYSSYRPVANAANETGKYQDLHRAIVEINRSEDLPMVSSVWQNYASLPTPAPLVFGRNEMILQHYHRDLAVACGIPLPVSADPQESHVKP